MARRADRERAMIRPPEWTYLAILAGAVIALLCAGLGKIWEWM